MSTIKYLCLFLFITQTSLTEAFNINPLNRKVVVEQGGAGFLNMITEPVHEVITRKARETYWIKCKKKGANETICPKNPQHPKTIQDSLIRGVWWSDDPNQNLYKGRQAIWIGNMKDAARRAKSSRYIIDNKYKMHYRSHYGDMQFMHAMASKDGERGEDTLKNIFMWAEYLYRIAIGQIGQDTLFKNVSVDGLDKYFQRQSNWKLKWIMQPRYLLRDTSNDFSKHALGALLHMVQDSFSDAHVERNYKPTKECAFGVINRFNSYTKQSSSKHGQADTLKAFNNQNFPEDFGPIEVSAELIWFANKRADWHSTVLPYLKEKVFCFEEKLSISGPGDYKK